MRYAIVFFATLILCFGVTDIPGESAGEASHDPGIAFSAPLFAQQRGGGQQPGVRQGRRRRPSIITGTVFADNWFQMYINGELVAVDGIRFTPHNVISVDLVQSYPMVIAVMAKDFGDPETGLEYDNTRIGDGGFILKFSDGTATNGTWKAQKFFWGPLDGNIANPQVRYRTIPDNWYAVDFDDSDWPLAQTFSVSQVNPHAPNYFDFDWSGAEFIWTADLELDNTIIFRTRIEGPRGE